MQGPRRLFKTPRRPPSSLLPSPLPPSRRLRSQTPRAASPAPSMSASQLAPIFEAAEEVFRRSLAFEFPQELTLRPHRQHVNGLMRLQLRQQDYERKKASQILGVPQRYVSSYALRRQVESNRLEL